MLFDSWIGSQLIVFVLQEDADARAIASWSLLGHPSMILIRTMGFTEWASKKMSIYSERLKHND